jgi:hypothetical protein
VRRLAGDPKGPTLLDRLRVDPAELFRASGKVADPWQLDLLRSTSDRLLLLCGRQMGKTEAASALVVRTALVEPGALVLVLSPSERQSGEFAQRAFGLYDALGQPVPSTKRTELQLRLANGSRIVALPDSERTIRGYAGVRLLVVDEASRVSDELYRACRPMLGVSKGRILALSTPFGRRGWFFDCWQGKAAGGRKDRWERVCVTADKCPRLDPDFLREERLELGERFFRQEYFCEFMEVIGTMFSGADIDAAVTPHVQALEFPR